jgi:nicotinate-nucleotide adenylyltransferase
MSERHIALFGGSFNPPHVGHVAIVGWVLACHEVDEVWAVPCFQHAFGKPLAPFDARARMVAVALAPFGDRASACLVEADLGGVSRTIDTLEALKVRHPEAVFSLVAGADVRAELPHWKEPERLASLARWIWLPRRGVAREPDEPPFLFPDISSSEVRERARRGLPLTGWVPREVEAWLRTERPYGDA